MAIPVGVIMHKLLQMKNLQYYFALAVVIIILLNIIFSDTSNAQSTQEINVTLKPCSLVDGVYDEISSFNLGNAPQICGEVLTDYIPLDLEYYIVNLETGREILFCEYIKITAREFTVILPDNLEAGKYKFEIKAGCRKHIAETNFIVLP